MVRRLHVTQYSFDKGVIDPVIMGRRDIRAYAGGMKRADNLIGVIGGPLKRRGGFAFVDTLPDAGQGVRLAPFQFGLEQSYLIVFTSGKIRIYRDDDEVTGGGIASPFTAGHLARLDYDQSLDTMLLVHEDVPPQQLQRQGSDSNWSLTAIAFRNLPTHRFGGPTAGTATPSGTTGTITITSSAGDFAQASVGDVIRVNNGKARITAINSASSVAASVDHILDNATAAQAGDWTVEEAVWSTARGWPRSVRLDGNRSYWGGSRSLPQRVWASASGGADIFDFLETKDRLEDEYVEDDLVGSQVNAISHIVTLGDQFFLTAGGVFVNAVGADSPVSVENFHPRKNAPTPVAPIRPVTSDGAVTCIVDDGSGRAVGCADIVYDVAEEAYVLDDLNTIAASVMRTPVAIAARFSDGVRAEHNRFVVNADGTIAVHQSLRRQSVAGWTLWNSPGAAGGDAAVTVTVVGNTPYFVMRRTIGGSDTHFLEKLDPDAVFDGGRRKTYAAPAGSLDGLGHLEGERVRVLADGALRDTAVVTGGEITITDGGLPVKASRIEAGFAIPWVLEPVPAEAAIADRTLAGQHHRIIAVTLELADTLPFTVNGRSVSFRRFGAFDLDTPPPPFSGRRRIRLLGWNRGEGESFRAEGILPITILSAIAEIGQ